MAGRQKEEKLGVEELRRRQNTVKESYKLKRPIEAGKRLEERVGEHSILFSLKEALHNMHMVI